MHIRRISAKNENDLPGSILDFTTNLDMITDISVKS
jgi:hypothetical protein